MPETNPSNSKMLLLRRNTQFEKSKSTETGAPAECIANWLIANNWLTTNLAAGLGVGVHAGVSGNGVAVKVRGRHRAEQGVVDAGNPGNLGQILLVPVASPLRHGRRRHQDATTGTILLLANKFQFPQKVSTKNTKYLEELKLFEIIGKSLHEIENINEKKQIQCVPQLGPHCPAPGRRR
jgi:hypothetical protein